VPDSAGKRQRREVKARKAAAIEERRLARNQRRTDRANGVLIDDPLDETPLTEAEAAERRAAMELEDAQEDSAEPSDSL
jgi:hypothetical protein